MPTSPPRLRSLRRRIWDLHTGTCRHVLQGHTGRINSLQLSADGKLAATAGEDGTARVWDVRRGHCRRVLTVSGQVCQGSVHAFIAPCVCSC